MKFFLILVSSISVSLSYAHNVDVHGLGSAVDQSEHRACHRAQHAAEHDAEHKCERQGGYIVDTILEDCECNNQGWWQVHCHAEAHGECEI